MKINSSVHTIYIYNNTKQSVEHNNPKTLKSVLGSSSIKICYGNLT